MRPLVISFLRLAVLVFPIAALFVISSNPENTVWWTFPIVEFITAGVSLAMLAQVVKTKVAAMPEGQKAIYYAAGDDRERLAKMPVVEAVLAKGYDVLLCTQDVDEFCFQAMREFTAKGLPKVYADDAAREAA